jgi:multiple sugar transport system substrate-binding protein
LAAAAVGPAGMLAACGGPGGPGESRSAAVTPGKLTIWGATNDGGHWEGDRSRPFVRAFEEKNPGVTIEPLRIVTAGTQYRHPDEKFFAAVAGGEGPDLYSTGSTGTALQWGQNGVVKALDDLMKGSKVVKPDRFLPLMLEEGSWKGKSYELYHSIDTRILFWNKDLYAASGLNPERAPDTWDEFADAITKTLRRDGDTISVLGYHPTQGTVGVHYWQAWLWSLGGTYLSSDAGKVAFSGETGIKALEWLLRVATIQGGTAPITSFVRSTAVPTGQGGLFRVQKAAHYIETAALLRLLDEQHKDVRYGIADIPRSAAGKRGSVRGGFGLVLPTNAKLQDAAWKFLEYHLDTDTLARWNDTFDRLPTTKEAANSPLYLKNSPVRKVQANVAAYSQRIPAIHPAAADIQAINVEMVNSALDGKQSPRQALESGAQQVQAILDQWKTR